MMPVSWMDRGSARNILCLGVGALLFIQGACRNSTPSDAKGRVQETMQDDSPEKKGIELSYDLGMVDMQHSPWSREPGGQLAVVFTPPFYPALVARVRFFVGIYGKPTTEFRVRIFRATATSGPEDHDLLTAAVTTAAPYGNRWVEVDLRKHEIIIPSGDFCVAMEWLTPPGDNGADAQYIGVDTSKPDKRSWWKTNRDTGWKPVEDIANIGDRDFMIRATVIKK